MMNLNTPMARFLSRGLLCICEIRSDLKHVTFWNSYTMCTAWSKNEKQKQKTKQKIFSYRTFFLIQNKERNKKMMLSQ